MATNIIKSKFGTRQTLTIQLVSLASNSAIGRQSTIVDNSSDKYQLIHLWCKIMVGTTPTANTRMYVYLIKSNGTERSDNAGPSDAAHPIVNARLLGIIRVPVNTSNTSYYGEFKIQNPGPQWGITITHDTGVALNSTASNHVISWVGENPDVQASA